MATKLHYFGDVGIASTHRADAELLLESLRRSFPNTFPTSLKHTYDDGTYISVQRASPGMETIDITAGVTTSEKDKMVWTLLYAPCPTPDPQDWPGWIEADRETLDAENFLNRFALIPWSDAFYGDFTTDDDLTLVVSAPSVQVTDGGWTCGGYGQAVYAAPTPAPPGYLGPCWQAYGIQRTGRARTDQDLTYTFPYDLMPPVSVSNWSETGSKAWVTDGGAYYTHGFVWIPSNSYGSPTPPRCTTDDAHPPGPYDPGYALSHGEGYISWQSLYMIGFWKVEWTVYIPSSFLDFDNYVGFYDKYVTDTNSSNNFLAATSNFYIVDMTEWMMPGADGYYAYWWTDKMREDYLNSPLGRGKTNNITFPNSEYDWGGVNGQVTIYDPDSDGSGGSLYTNTYETHMFGKYEGIFFDETIGTAVESPSGTWNGDNIFPWMGRVYDKQYLLEGDLGEEVPSEHHLMIVSWLSGPPIELPGMGSSWVEPGCSGITSTTYRARHGAVDVTKSYGASHPGWHDVYTSDPDSSLVRTWRAYGDLFAALKVVKTA